MDDICRVFHEKWRDEVESNNNLLRQLLWVISVICWENKFNMEFKTSDDCYVCCPKQFEPIIQEVIDVMNSRVDLMVDYDDLPDYVKDNYDFLCRGFFDE